MRPRLATIAAACAAVLCAIAAPRVDYLDPYTCVLQTDDPAEGERLSREPGYWRVPQGLVDPVSKKPQARIVHTCFRKLDTPFPEYDPAKPSRLFKVDQVGYAPLARKFAYVGAWLGPKLGEWKPKKPMESWRVADAATGETVFQDRLPPFHRIADDVSKEGIPFTGEATYEMDFSCVTNEGVYFVEIPGVGRSRNFRIASGAAEDAFRVHMGGLYQKRCGIAKTEPYTHWTAGACHQEVVRGTFAPEEGKLSPKSNWFPIIRDNTDWDGPKIRAVGGWHDAADYDRRPSHLKVVSDLCAVYMMRPENFTDGQLAIPENKNGIPDILDEAEWGLRHLLAVQQPDGGVGTWIETTGHPGPGNVAERDHNRYAVSRATRKSSLSYAACAAQLARCHDSFREKYLASAIRAWDFAMRERPQRDVFEVVLKKGFFSDDIGTFAWEESDELPSSYLAKAAIDLYELTGDEKYLDRAAREEARLAKDARANSSNWSALMFSGEMARLSPKVAAKLPKFLDAWKKRLLKFGGEMVGQVSTAYAYHVPWWPPRKGWCNAMGWGHCHPLKCAQTLVAAHAITGEAKYLDAALLANNFHNGCNPQGTTLTSGLGEVYPVAFLDLPSYVDGIAEYVPGITPYRWIYSMPPKAVEMVWDGDRATATKWPIWRRWGNVESRSVAASEYTVWETIAPAASVTGYLLTPSGKPPAPQRAPANDIRTLPGYWLLP